MFKKTLLNNINSRNDIKYNPPLSYRHIRIFGWLMMALLTLSIVFSSLGGLYELDETLVSPINFVLAGDITGYFGQLAIPFFLLANFALILSSRENVKKLVIFHASMALLIIALYLLCYDRYIVGLANYVFSLFGIENGKVLIDMFMLSHFTRYLSLNVFIDLLMCSLLYLFLVYKPKNISEKSLRYYRLLTVLPILYELASVIIKGLSLGAGLFQLPMEVLPFLTNKPVVTFLSFIAIIFYLKYQKKIYLKLGGNKEGYEEYLQTNAHSFRVGVVMALSFAIAGILDLIVTSIMMACFSSNFNALESFASFKEVMNMVQPWGFGKGISLMAVAPLALLFNYRKTYDIKTKNYDLVIPVVGVVVCLLILLEGGYQILTL